MKDLFGLLRKRLFLAGVAVAASIAAVLVGVVLGPRIAHKISSQESNLRSIAASKIPTGAPSPSPSEEPTSMPSEVPTRNPTTMPSLVPTITPAPSRSKVPSTAPTDMPTKSNAPTFGTFDRWASFRLKLHFEPEYYWQDSPKEQFWCVSCARCLALNFAEEPISDFNCTDALSCVDGDQLWLRDCRQGFGSTFRAVDTDDGFLLRLNGFGTCVTRIRRDFLAVHTCNASDITQKWRPISLDRPFELVPKYYNPNDFGSKYCVTQHHHPKEFEILGMKDCDEAQYVNTSLYEAYPLEYGA